MHRCSGRRCKVLWLPRLMQLRVRLICSFETLQRRLDAPLLPLRLRARLVCSASRPRRLRAGSRELTGNDDGGEIGDQHRLMAVPGVLEAEHPLPVLLGAVHHPHPHGRGVDRAQHLVDGLRLEVPVVGALFVGLGAAAAAPSCRRGATVKRRRSARRAAARRSAARATTDIALFLFGGGRGCARPVLRLIAFRPFLCALPSGARRGACTMSLEWSAPARQRVWGPVAAG